MGAGNRDVTRGSDGLSRRELIRRSALAGALAWTAPVIVGSLTSPAAAASTPGQCYWVHWTLSGGFFGGCSSSNSKGSPLSSGTGCGSFSAYASATTQWTSSTITMNSCSSTGTFSLNHSSTCKFTEGRAENSSGSQSPRCYSMTPGSDGSTIRASSASRVDNFYMVVCCT